MCGQVYERCQAGSGIAGESGSGSGHDLERVRELMQEGHEVAWPGSGLLGECKQGCGWSHGRSWCGTTAPKALLPARCLVPSRTHTAVSEATGPRVCVCLAFWEAPPSPILGPNKNLDEASLPFMEVQAWDR